MNNLLNNKSKIKDNNINTLLSKKNSILNSSKNIINNNLIPKVKKENGINFTKDESPFKLNAFNKEQYIYDMKKEIKNGILLNNSFTSFYIKNNNLNLNKYNNTRSFIYFDNHKEEDSIIIPVLKDKLSLNLKLRNSRSKHL